MQQLRKLLFILTLMMFLVWTAWAGGHELYIYGSLENVFAIEDQKMYSVLVDLGDHGLSDEEWEHLLPGPGEVVILPSPGDVATSFDILGRFADEGHALVLSDRLEMDEGVFLPFFRHTENYRSVLFFNFVDDSLDSLAPFLEEIERALPDRIIVVGTAENLPFLMNGFVRFEDRITFIDRQSVTADFSQVLTVEELPVVKFFWSSRCLICRRIKNEIAAPLLERYQDEIKVLYLDYIFAENYEKLVELEEFWQVKEKASVTVFTEAGYLASEDETTFAEELEALIVRTLGLPEGERRVFPVNVPGSAMESLIQRFEGMTLWVVAGAGLLDGLNPCAFATIVFMVNLLLALGYNRNKILKIGLTYSMTVYVVYFLLGLLLFQIWQVLEGYYFVTRIMYGAMASLLLIFAVFSIKDAIQYKKDKKETGFSLGLPKGIRIKINQYLKKNFTDRNLIVAAVLSGVVISVLEATCTGQIYFPIIMLIHAETTYRLRAIMYLLLYNAFFIVPLLVVFATVYYGSQSKALVSFGRKNILFSKIALAGLFFMLSILLWGTALY
ncbi:MAG TPA: hypothetical protein VLH40_05065 [Atribacteraceae bacterium]|nr:hypothetical protein [Atribacteraceae bacterium]